MASPGKNDRFPALHAARFCRPDKLRTDAWLSNFRDSEKAAAKELLERLVVVPEIAVTGMLRRTIGRIVQSSVSMDAPINEIDAALTARFNRLRFTPIAGENPNPSDSGNFVCRILRYELGIPEARILSGSQALEAAEAGSHLVLVDDFAGTGAQFGKYWVRKLRSQEPSSLKALADSGCSITYCCPVVTKSAAHNIALAAPSLHLEYAHMLGYDYCCAGPRAPSPVSTEAQALLKRVGPDLDVEGYIDCELGFQQMALAVAFEHNIPDASLPIFWAKSRTASGWVPLQERR